MRQLSDLCFLWNKRMFWMVCLLFIVGKTAGAYTPDDNPPAPKVLAIGNRIFQDYNRNGVQDDGEPGISKIPVRLYQNGVQRGETSTDEKGQYAFDDAGVKGGLQPNTVYEIRVNSTDFPAGFQLTKRKQGSDPNLDSDAQLIGGLAVVYANTGAAGTPNDSYDIGLAAGNPDLSITKSATTSKVTKGSNASFTIRVDNTGDGPATNVIVKDTLDAGMTYVSSSPAATVSTTPSSQTVLTWNLGTIAAAGTSNLSLTVNTQAEGVLYNTAYVTTTDTEVSTRNNVSRACVSVPIKLCPGDRYVASLPAQYTNVKWYKDNGTTAIATGNSFTITQAGSYSFTTTTNVDCPANGCCPIIVEDGIVPNLAITPASPAVCAGGSTSLTLTGCGNGTIKWSSGESTASIVVAPTATTTYSVTCTSATYGTCTGTASTTVTVNPLPVVALSSATICAGQTASLTATAGYATYAFSAGLTPVPGQPNVATGTAAGTYSVTATTSSGCSATATGSITVNPLPVVTLSSATICAGQTASLTATAGYATYTFSSGLTPVQGQPNVATGTTAGTYSVTATTSSGCSATATGSIMVNPLPVVALSSTTICAGQTASLTATSGYTSYVFSAGLTPVPGQPNVATGTTAGTYSVTATTASGCSATATGSITVNPLPVVALSSTTICAGQTASLTATSGYASYVFSSGLTSVPGQPNVATGTAAGTYSVTATTSSGCSATATGSITVNPLPVVALSSATICAGQTASLTATAGYASYNFSSGLTPVQGQPNVATATAAGTYSVTATTSSGCSATATGSITVNPLPVVALSSATICAGQTASLTATAGYATYAYSAGLTPVPGQPNVATGTAAGTYSVTATTSSGCSATATGSITVNPLPVVALSSATICAGQTASLTATAGYATYTFSSGLTPVQGQPNVATGTTAGTYSVTATTSSGCSATATGSITVNPLPTASITVSSATICQGQSATLTASGGATYRWSTNEQTASIVVTTSGVYSVTATNAQGCSDDASTTITVNPAPVLTVNSPTLCAGQSATLTVGGCQGGTLVWNTGDNTASLIVAPLVTTTYSATCTVSTGCTSTTAATVTVNAAPTYEAAPTATVATCNGGTPNNDARIDLTTLQNVERADIVKGSSYGSGPAYGAASNKVVVNGSVSFTNLANPTEKQPYTVRLFTAKGTCYTDVTVMLDAATCECPTPKCVPVVVQKIR